MIIAPAIQVIGALNDSGHPKAARPYGIHSVLVSHYLCAYQGKFLDELAKLRGSNAMDPIRPGGLGMTKRPILQGFALFSLNKRHWNDDWAAFGLEMKVGFVRFENDIE